MKRRAAHIIILVALLLTALAGAAVAQDEELTLEGVSTFIGELRSEAESLTEQVIGLVARVEAIEGKLTHSAYLDYGGDCRLAIRERMHTVSMVNYLERYPDSDAPNRINIENVYEVEDAVIAVTIRVDESPNDRLVTEYYDGCDFVGLSEWWAVDYSGEKIGEAEE